MNRKVCSLAQDQTPVNQPVDRMEVYGEDMSAPCPTPKLKDHPLLIVHSLQIVATILHVWRPFPPTEAVLDMDYYYIQQHHSTKKQDNYHMMCRQNMFGVTELFPAVDTFMGNKVCQASKKVPAHLAFINQVTLISQ